MLKKNIVLTSTLVFFIGSVILNLAWTFFTGTPHYQDIIHLYPIAIFSGDTYGVPKDTMDIITGIITVITDTFVGFILGLVLNKIEKAKKKALPIIIVAFFIYFFILCYQFIPFI